jgi:type II secretory pathway pseudopilin PulG
MAKQKNNQSNLRIESKAPAIKGLHGQSLVQVMIAVAVTSILTLAIMSLMQISLRQQGQSNLTFQASTLRQNILQAVNNYNGWQNTINAASNNLSCLARGATTFCTNNGIDIASSNVVTGAVPLQNVSINQIFDASNKVVYDNTAATSGLTLQGAACSNFVSPASGPGNDSCPLRFEVHWSAVCKCVNASCSPVTKTDTCANPQVRLQIVAIYNPSAQAAHLAFNPSNYGTIPFYQGTDPGSACWMVSGDAVYETCGFVGIGTAVPDSSLTLTSGGSPIVPPSGVNDTGTLLHMGGTNNSKTRLLIDSYGISGNPSHSLLTFRRAEGSPSVPSAVLSGDSLGEINASGYDGTSFTGSRPNISFIATENWSTTNSGSAISFTTTQNGTTTGFAERMRIDNSGNVGIGTTTPNTTLEVNGGIYTHGSNFELRDGGVVDSTAVRAFSSSGNLYLQNGNGTSGATYFRNAAAAITMTVQNSGNVVITGSAQATSFLYSSDRRLKENIAPLDGYTLAKGLEGVSFNWKASGAHEIGLIAQDVEKIAPELVVTDAQGMKSVKYGNIVAILIEAFKTQDQIHTVEIDELKRRLNRLEQIAIRKSAQP